MQLEGTLATFPLRELIEMVIYSSVTGVLEVQSGSDIGQIYFRDGRPYHAVAGEHSGIMAISAMFELQDAPFRFVSERVSVETTLWMDPWDMLEQALEQARQWQYVRRFIPSIEHVPHLIGTLAQSQVQIPETSWPVLAMIDGHRPITEISRQLNLVLLDTCLALAPMIEQKLVVIGPPRPIVAQATPNSSLAADAAATEAGGFLERLLADAQAQEQQRPDLTDERAQERKQVYRYVDDRR